MKFEVRTSQFALNTFKKQVRGGLNFENAHLKLQRPVKFKKTLKRERRKEGQPQAACGKKNKIDRCSLILWRILWADRKKNSGLGQLTKFYFFGQLEAHLGSLQGEVNLQSSNVKLAKRKSELHKVANQGSSKVDLVIRQSGVGRKSELGKISGHLVIWMAQPGILTKVKLPV